MEGLVALAYEKSTGLTVDLGAGVEIIVVPEPIPGPLTVDAVVLRVGLTADRLTAHALVDVTAKLGIVRFTVAGTGFELDLPLVHPPTPVVTFVPLSKVRSKA